MGLMVDILTRRGDRDSSNGGVSAGRTQAVVVNASGPFDPDPERPAILLMENGPGLLRAVPAELVDGKWVPLRKPELIGPMFGGAYIACCDSRFRETAERIAKARFYGAVALHDRFETQEQYDRLSV